MLKYIIVQDKRTEYPTPIIFSEELIHKQVYQGLHRTHNILSAGFCYKDKEGNWVAEGESESLKVKSNCADSIIINLFVKEGASGLDLMNLLIYFEIQQGKKNEPS